MDNTEPDREKSDPALMPDLGNPHYCMLASYARSIRDLLAALAAGVNPELAGSIDGLLGAVCALIQARHHRFEDRNRRYGRFSTASTG